MKRINMFLWAHIFALFCSISWAKSCEVPVSTMNVAGLKIGQHIREFQQHHPSAKTVILGGIIISLNLHKVWIHKLKKQV